MKVALSILVLLTSLSIASHEETDRHTQQSHHSDTLLLLLQQKLNIQLMQKEFASLNKQGKWKNLGAQGKSFTKAMTLLGEYVQVPESHYRSASEYQGSLKDRAEVMTEITQLMSRYLSQLQQANRAEKQ